MKNRQKLYYIKLKGLKINSMLFEKCVLRVLVEACFKFKSIQGMGKRKMVQRNKKYTHFASQRNVGTARWRVQDKLLPYKKMTFTI